MPRPYPSPDDPYPLVFPDGTVARGTVHLRAVVDHPRLEIGAYTYASAFDPPEDWAARLFPYLFAQAREKVSLGKFCQIADGVQIITSSANHRFDGFSSFPFAVFDMPHHADHPSWPEAGPDTVIGHDVWLGQGARILPRAQIGSGVIVGAGAVLGGTVPDYAIVAGNPARVVRMRFPAEIIARLMRAAWWDWPIEHILAHEAAICGGDIDALEAANPLASSGGQG